MASCPARATAIGYARVSDPRLAATMDPKAPALRRQAHVLGRLQGDGRLLGCRRRDGVGRPHRAIDAVWRIESAKLIAGLARIVRDVGLAEELAQDALVAALEQWPGDGVPDNPGAWLMATAKHRAIDRIRRNVTAASASTSELGAGARERSRR